MATTLPVKVSAIVKEAIASRAMRQSNEGTRQQSMVKYRLGDLPDSISES